MYLKNKLANLVDFVCPCWYKFMKTESDFSNFCVSMIKNWFGLFAHCALKPAVSRKWIDDLGWFFGWWYKFVKAKCEFNNFWVGMIKSGCDLCKN